MSINKITQSDIATFTARNNMNDYQHIAGKSAVYPGKGTIFGLWYCITKLNGEAGEAAEHIGKAFRDDGVLVVGATRSVSDNIRVEVNELFEDRKIALAKELGDSLWYIARAAHELGFTLSEIAQLNLRKLADRSEREVLQGSGDKR